jgi:hypothetical protein
LNIFLASSSICKLSVIDTRKRAAESNASILTDDRDQIDPFWFHRQGAGLAIFCIFDAMATI